MHPVVRNILAVIVGVVVGGMVNGALVNVGPHVVPPPAGADVSTMEGLRDSMKLYTPIHFLFPFLAHALGTLVGAASAAKLAASRRMGLAIGIGAFFLIGGIAAVVMLNAPMWFNVTDLVLAYLPMGYLGGRLGGGGATTTTTAA